MQIFNQKKTLLTYLSDKELENVSIGFVPTMGALHKGHLSLVNQSKRDNDITVVSIFVNPTQFNNSNDFINYPNSLHKDLDLLKQINCDIVFTPSSLEMYGEQESSEHFNFGAIENEMEGAFRKGHFNGVGTIVKKLFQVVQPTRAYFGEKDFQQLQIIKKLVELETINIEIIGCPISREANGLAMSSRNERLTKQERAEAGLIYQILSITKRDYMQKSVADLTKWAISEFQKHPLIELEYFSIVDEKTLKTIKSKDDILTPRAFVAAYINSVRLIDNMALYR